MKKLILICLILILAMPVSAGNIMVMKKKAPAGECTTSNDSTAGLYDYSGGAHQFGGGGDGAVNSSLTGGGQFTTSVTKMITQYVVYLADINDEGTLTLAIYTNNSGSIGTIVSGSSVAIAASAIPAGPGLVEFTLETPLELSAGTYWIVGKGATEGDRYYFFIDSGTGRVKYSSDYLDNYVSNISIYGCTK